LTLYLILKNYLDSSDYSGTTINLDPISILKTFLYQLIGVLPFIYYCSLLVYEAGLNSILVFLFYIIFAIIYVKIFIKKIVKIDADVQQILIYGLLIIISCSIPIALSKRYQVELLMGSAYTVAYLQMFGLSIIIAKLFNTIRVQLYLLIIVINFILNSLIVINGIKIDNAKKIQLQVFLTQDIVNKFHYDATYFNEQLFEADELFNRHVGINFGNPLYTKDKMCLVKEKSFRKIGIFITTSYYLNNNFILVGNLNCETYLVTELHLIAVSYDKINELKHKFNIEKVDVYLSLNNKQTFIAKVTGELNIKSFDKSNFRHLNNIL
jgi:hypothetical protein